MIRKLLILGILFTALLISCGASRVSDPAGIIDKITYVRDNQTGLCFALVRYDIGQSISMGMACVPCDSVWKFLKDQ